MSYQMPLNELLQELALNSECTDLVTSLSSDSRKIVAGGMYFAIKGHAVDGRQYMRAAQANGAVAIVYEAHESELIDGLLDELTVPAFAVHGLASMIGYVASAFYQDPSQALQVFGVTGTNGKTTCCYLLVQALTALGMEAGMIGTIGVGTLTELKDSGLTTPGPIEVQKALSDFRDQGVTQVCMEVSSHALDQGRVNGVDFFCTLFTNLSHDHLDYHGDMTQYGLAKQRLFTDFHSELVVTNASDELGSHLVDVANADFIVQYGAGGDVCADEVQLNARGITMVIEGNGVEFEVETSLVGKVNVPNIEMLVATLLALSTSVDDIQRVVRDLHAAPGRMELYAADDTQPKVIVDYAHTPDALEKALLSVREHCKGALWCVFGCGGDRDSDKRAVMGRLAEQHADRLVITNDNPRTENPDGIAQHILDGLKQAEAAKVILDRAQAIRFAVAQADARDWVVVAGKGHEATQTIGQNVLPFSDREQVINALEELA